MEFFIIILQVKILIQTTIFFILGWFSISFCLKFWPNLFMNKGQEIKEIENQPRFKKIVVWIKFWPVK